MATDLHVWPYGRFIEIQIHFLEIEIEISHILSYHISMTLI